MSNDYTDREPKFLHILFPSLGDKEPRNQKLREFSRDWELSGDLLRCKACERSQIASRQDEDFVHRSDCSIRRIGGRPWTVLQSILLTLPSGQSVMDQLAAANERCRAITQRIIEAIGSVGPEDAEQAVDRVLAQLAAANAQRDELRCELDQLDIYLRCRGAAGETILARVQRIEHEGKAAVNFWQKAQTRGDVLQQQLDQCVQEREALAKSCRETVDDRDALLHIINDAFLSLHIPGSTKAFDGRNLVVHAKDSADVAMVLRGERDEARRDLASLMAAAKSLTEDPNACWEDFLAAVDAIARAQSGQPAHRDDAGTASGGGAQ